MDEFVQQIRDAITESSCSSVYVINAGDGELASKLGQCARLVLADRRYFQRTAWWQQVEPRLRSLEARLDCEVVARRFPKKLEDCIADVVKEGSVVLVANEPEAAEALRVARCFEAVAAAGRCAIVAAGLQPPSTLLSWAARNVVFAPADGYAFSAREVRDGAEGCWTRHVRAACACVASGELRYDQPAPTGDIWRVVASQARPCRPGGPVLRFPREQLDDVKRRALQHETPTWLLRDGSTRVSLVASTAGRYVEGGYAACHYVKTPPDERDVCYELATRDESMAFVSIGATQFNGRDDWPFAVPERPLDVACVSRLVVLEPWRRRGALDPLLRGACDVFHRMGLPCRITTRKDEVAAKVFRRCALLAEEDAPRRRKLARQASEATTHARAIVPYEASNLFFQTITPTRTKARGKNIGFTFWYVGTPVCHPRSGRPFTFVGGNVRFAPAAKLLDDAKDVDDVDDTRSRYDCHYK